MVFGAIGVFAGVFTIAVFRGHTAKVIGTVIFVCASFYTSVQFFRNNALQNLFVRLIPAIVLGGVSIYFVVALATGKWNKLPNFGVGAGIHV